MVGRSRRDDGLGLADISVNLLEALQEAGQGAGTDGDVGSDLYVARAQFAGNKADGLLGRRVFDPQEIVGQQFAKAPVHFADSFSLDCKTAFEAAAVNPFLYQDVRLGFKLQVTLAGVFAVVVLERPLDVHGMRVVSFDQVGVVAVHRTDQAGKRGRQGREQAAAEP